jgi:CheY-like chemotaxis protein
MVHQLALVGAETATADSCAAALDRLRAEDPAWSKFDCVLVSDTALAVGFVPAARAVAQARILLLEASTAIHGRRAICDDFNAVLMRPVGAETLCEYIRGTAAVGERDSAAQDGPGPFAHLRPIRILLAEDNQTNQLVASKMLAALGLRTDVVGNGLEAVEAARSAPYDLIFMDVMMPELDGLGAARAIRNLPAPANGAHIIALTANATREDRDKCLAAGMNDFLPKPFKRDRLQQAIEWYFGLQPAPAIETVATTDDEDRLLEHEMFRTLSEEIGPDGAAHILSVFLTSNTQRLDVMRQGVDTGDRETVEREAHSMKSAAATFGFRHLSELARELEREADGLDHDELGRRVSRLSAAFGEVEKSARRTMAVA